MLSVSKTKLRHFLSWGVALLGSFIAVAGEANDAIHWSFRPIKHQTIPNKVGENIVDAALAKCGVQEDLLKQGVAGKRILIRRLSFDLRGLPPTPEEVAEFAANPREDAYERLVDRYLGSPEYGERWGRHWLDMVAYADSNGYFSADSDRPLAWKFRDYVVASINADKPLDRFILEQIAGDELVRFNSDGDVTPDKVEPLIATHFWRNVPDGTGESDGNPLEVKVDQYSVLEGNVQLIGSAFLGLTLQCARCHDHKFEPVTQRDYYALQAIMRPAFDPARWIKPNDRAIAIGTKADVERNKREIEEHQKKFKLLQEGLDGLTTPFRKRAIDDNLAPLKEDLRKLLQQALEAKSKDRTDGMKALLKTNDHLVTVKDEELVKRFPEFAAAAAPLQQSIKFAEAHAPKPAEKIAPLVEPARPLPEHHLLTRGNHAREGEVVSPALPVVFVTKDSAVSVPESGLKTSGRRLMLGRWLVSRENPIVGRVLVNRIWSLHFGSGLVGSTENLGRSGAPPQHPELLDALVQELWWSGWSLKRLTRLIVTSATYRSRFPRGWDEGAEMAPRRIDAESLRDAMLAVSGELDLRKGGFYTPVKLDKEGQANVEETHPGAKRRSLYMQQRRTQSVHFVGIFDGPSHNPVCIQRVPSTVPLQSLSLLNSDFVRHRAQAFARRVLAESSRVSSNANDAVIHRAFSLAYNRAPTTAEILLSKKFLAGQKEAYAGQGEARENVWTDFCQMLLASNEFLYVD